MKSGTIVLLSVFAFAPLSAMASQQLIPAGALIQCTVSEPKLNSKTTAIGDPVLCQVGHAERFGRTVLPYNSFLVGRFEDYKDPGHFVGKGWMELKFDRMVIEPNTIIPVDAKVVAVPGYNVDRDGRILGKGHAVRDTVMWTIPILWPIDLITLPARGPRPSLKAETRLTLKVMDDLEVPTTDQPQPDPYGLMHRQTGEVAAPPAPVQETAPPVQAMADDPSLNDQPVYQDEPVADPPPVVAYQPAPVMAAPPVVVAYGGSNYAPLFGGGYAYASPARGYVSAARPMIRAPHYYSSGGYNVGAVGRMGYAPRTTSYAPRAVAYAPRNYASSGNYGGQRGYAGSYARIGGAVRSGGYGGGGARGGGGRR